MGELLSARTDEVWLSLAKSDSPFESIAQTSSCSEQHQLIKALDKRQTKVSELKKAQPANGKFISNHY